MAATFRRSAALLVTAAALVALWPGSTGCAAAKKPDPKKIAYVTVEDALKAGPDFAIQGEYEGAVAGRRKVGVQVIALGGGAFQALVYPGGLPGAGWDQTSKILLDGKLEGGKAVFAAAQGPKKYNDASPARFSAVKSFPPTGQKAWTATIAGEKLTGKTDAGEAIEAVKVQRKSPTLGAKPAAGAIVLFDGTGTDEWNRGRMDRRKLLSAGAGSKRTFQSFTLHAEFVTPFRPYARGQGRGNSGVYLQHRYEIQVLDSFGLEGYDNECGGIYKKGRPKVNMCFPPLTWQTYDVEFTAPRFDGGRKIKNAFATIKHNGVVIHEKLEIDGKTGGSKGNEGEPGAVYLQGHGNPVFFRNIWIVPGN